MTKRDARMLALQFATGVLDTALDAEWIDNKTTSEADASKVRDEVMKIIGSLENQEYRLGVKP